MKKIFSELVWLAPVSIGILLTAYIVQEVTEYQIGQFDDIILPVAGLLVLILISVRLVPLVQAEIQKAGTKKDGYSNATAAESKSDKFEVR